MKKLTAIVLCIAMLLSAFALGEGVQFTLKDVVVTAAGQTTDLTGFNVVVRAGAQDDRGGVELSFAFGTTQIASVMVAMLGQQILLDFDANDGQLRAYYVDLGTLLGVLGQQINLDLILDSFGEAFSGNGSIFGDQFNGLFAGCASDGGFTKLEGENYHVTQIDVNANQMRAVIEALVDWMEQQGTYNSSDAEEVLKNLFSYGQEYTVSGAYYDGDGSDILDLTLNMSVSGLSGALSTRLYAVSADNGAGGRQIDVDLIANVSGEEYALGLTFDFAELYDLSWLPVSVGGATDMLTLGDNLQAALTEDMQALGQSIAYGVAMALLFNRMSA